MKKTIALLVLSGFFMVLAYSQSPKKGIYQTEHNKLFINKDLGIYLWLSTSPDENSEKVRLFSDTSKKYSNPMYLDTEGYNTVRSPSAVDTNTKRTVYPIRDIIFEVYADGIAPKTQALFKNSPKKVIDGKLYYSKALSIQLKTRDAVSGLSKLVYSLNGATFTEYKEKLKNFKEGENTLKYYASDHVGNLEETHEVVFYIDNTPPLTNYEIVGNKNEKYVSVNATIKLTSKDKLSGVKSIYYQINQGTQKKYYTPIPVKMLADDKSMISYYAIDNLGNKENSHTIGGNDSIEIEGEEGKLNYEFYVDREPPQVKLEILSDTYKGKYNYVSTTSKFKIDASDTKSGVNIINYSINNSAVDQVYKDPFNLDKKGLHYIRIQATDYVGNSSNASLKAYFCDPTPPTTKIAIGSPKFTSRDTLFVSPKTKFTLSSTDEIAGVSGTNYSIDNNTAAPYSKAFSLDKEGLHTIQYTSKDNVNNTEEEKTLEFYVDGTGPKIHYHFSVESIGSKQVRDENYTIYPTNTMIYVAATDARSGGEKIEYLLNDGAAKIDNPIKSLAPGNYQVKIKAFDVLGNTSSEEIKFAIEE